MKPKLKILFLEDNLDYAEHVKSIISKSKIKFVDRVVQTKIDYIHELKGFSPDIILSENTVPSLNSSQAFLLKKEFSPSAIFIVITDTLDKNSSLKITDADFDASIPKKNIKQIPSVIKSSLLKKLMISPGIDAGQDQRDQEFFLKESQRIGNFGFYNLNISDGKWTSTEVLDRIFGLEPDEEKTISSWIELMHPDQKEEMLNYLNSVIQEKKQFDKEYRIIRKKDGAERWILGKGELKFDVKGNPVYMIGTAKDITERKQAEFEKDHLLNFNKRLIENSPIGILLYRVSSGQCVLANEAAGKAVGTTPEKLLAQNFLEIASWKESGLLKSAELAIEKEESQKFTARFTTTFGRNVWLDCQTASMLMEGEKHLLLMIIDITERKNAEEALKESEEKFRTIFDNASDGILLADARTKHFVMGNKRICKMLGYTKNELLNLSIADIHPKEDLPAIIEVFEKQLRKEIEIAENLPVKRADGSIFFADINSSPQTINGENYLFGVFRDITERKLAKESLQKSEEKFYSLFENARDPILLIDETSQFIACNTATVKILGAESKEQLLPIHPSEISPKYQPDGQLSSIKAEQMIKYAYEHGSNQFEWVHRKLDGTPIFMDISLTVIPIENKNILMVHWRDITNYKKVEEALRLSEEQFKSIIEQAADGILLGSGKGIIIGANQQVSNITGFSQQELLGKNINMLFSEKELEKSPLRYDLLDLGIVVRNERSITKRDGSLIPIEMNTKKMPDNSYYTYQAIIRDITERKTSEELKQKIEKTEYENKVKSQFMANLSHEIRNPLNAIIGLNSLISKSELNPDQKKISNAISLSSNNLLTILNDILDFSKIEANKTDLHLSDFNLREMLEELILLSEAKAGEKKLDLLLNVSKEVPEFVNSDQNKIRQIIINLLGNALKFTEQGKVEISVGLINKEKDDLIIEFTIKDSGIGIQEKDFDKIFQSFTQLDSSTKKTYAGTGLGLSICKSYVELLGGNIHLTSEFGSGSEFSFSIPIKIGQSGKNNEEKNTFTNNLLTNFKPDTKFHILIAEDDAINRLYLTSLLKSQNFTVDSASNGFKALELFKEKKYDLIIMDCQMPKMDGFEATQKIREFENQNQLLRTNIIALTGYNKSELSEKFSNAEMDDYIIKPINEAELFRKIMVLVNKQ